MKSEIGGDVVLLDAAHDADVLAERIRARFHVETTVLENQVRIEREGAHRFVTEVVEAFPGEIEAISVSKPALEDVFIRRTGHKFWSETKRNAQRRKSAQKITGGNVLSMMLVLSLVLGILPLLGMVWIFVSGMITLSPLSATVDGLFMSLILLALSGTFAERVLGDA